MDRDDPDERARDLQAIAAADRLDAQDTRATAADLRQHSEMVREQAQRLRDRARNLMQFLVLLRARRAQRARAASDESAPDHPENLPERRSGNRAP